MKQPFGELSVRFINPVVLSDGLAVLSDDADQGQVLTTPPELDEAATVFLDFRAGREAVSSPETHDAERLADEVVTRDACLRGERSCFHCRSNSTENLPASVNEHHGPSKYGPRLKSTLRTRSPAT